MSGHLGFTPTERLERLYSPEPMSGCWLWIGATDDNGYGRFNLKAKGEALAHRASWTLYRGEIPAGIYVLHRCDNPPCVNPDHLFLGTQMDNLQDAARKGRTDRSKRARGEAAGPSKLTNEQVSNILADMRTHEAIAKSFGVWRSTIRRIKSRAHWKHIAPPEMFHTMNQLKIRERDRCGYINEGGRRYHVWTEYQVVRGRKIIARLELQSQAERYIAEQATIAEGHQP